MLSFSSTRMHSSLSISSSCVPLPARRQCSMSLLSACLCWVFIGQSDPGAPQAIQHAPSQAVAIAALAIRGPGGRQKAALAAANDSCRSWERARQDLRSSAACMDQPRGAYCDSYSTSRAVLEAVKSHRVETFFSSQWLVYLELFILAPGCAAALVIGSLAMSEDVPPLDEAGELADWGGLGPDALRVVFAKLFQGPYARSSQLSGDTRGWPLGTFIRQWATVALVSKHWNEVSPHMQRAECDTARPLCSTVALCTTPTTGADPHAAASVAGGGLGPASGAALAAHAAGRAAARRRQRRPLALPHPWELRRARARLWRGVQRRWAKQ